MIYLQIFRRKWLLSDIKKKWHPGKANIWRGHPFFTKMEWQILYSIYLIKCSHKYKNHFKYCILCNLSISRFSNFRGGRFGQTVKEGNMIGPNVIGTPKCGTKHIVISSLAYNWEKYRTVSNLICFIYRFLIGNVNHIPGVFTKISLSIH